MPTRDWDLVKRTTLWDYEALIQKLEAVLAYRFVQEHYDHTLPQAAYARKLLPASGWKELAGVERQADRLERLGRLGLSGYGDLTGCVRTRAACEAFLQATGFEFEDLVHTLNYLFRWALPFPTPVRELLDVSESQEAAYYNALKKQKIRTNLDLLEVGRRPAGQAQLANASGIPPEFLHGLVHRSDIARLPWVRGKTVMAVSNAGFDTLAKIAAAEPTQMEAELDVYFRLSGKTWAGYKPVIILPYLVGGARVLPGVVTFND